MRVAVGDVRLFFDVEGGGIVPDGPLRERPTRYARAREGAADAFHELGQWSQGITTQPARSSRRRGSGMERKRAAVESL